MPYLFALTLLLAPTYVIRFGLFGLPLNVLMVWVFVVWIVFTAWLLARHQAINFLKWLSSELTTYYLLFAILFLLSGVVSLFIGGFSQDKLGQFLVLFLQPIGTFLLLRYLSSIGNWKLKIGNLLTQTALCFVAIAGLYAILQYFTLIGVPAAWWGNSVEPKRAVAFFLHPNFYALFVTPLLAFLLPQVAKFQITKNKSQIISNIQNSNSETNLPRVGLIKDKRLRINNWLPIAAWLLGAIGLLLSLSRGGWLGLAAAIGVYILVAGNRFQLKRAAVLFAISLVVVLAIPNFRYRILLPFRGEKSSVARFSLWNTGWKMVKDSPVAGKGLLGFSNNWYAYNTDPGLQHYPAPHNIALNFWVDTGLLGLLSFFGLLILVIVRGIKNRENIYKLGLALACIALFVHGLIDIPYLKNDLALIFWMLLSVI